MGLDAFRFGSSDLGLQEIGRCDHCLLGQPERAYVFEVSSFEKPLGRNEVGKEQRRLRDATC